MIVGVRKKSQKEGGYEEHNWRTAHLQNLNHHHWMKSETERSWYLLDKGKRLEAGSVSAQGPY